MSDEAVDLNRFFVGSPQTILERTLIAEYLLSRGYLLSDLKRLARTTTPNAFVSILCSCLAFSYI